MGKKDVRSKIIDLLINKAAVKQDVADFSEGILELFKKAVKKSAAFVGFRIFSKRILNPLLA